MQAALLQTPQISAFGREAERIAKRFSPDVSLMLCDGSNSAEALALAMQRHRENDHYLVCPILEDPLVRLTRDAANSIFQQFQSADERRQLFEALAFGALHLNGAQITQQHIYPPEVLHTMREFSQLGDGLYVRSATERTRIETTFGRKRMYVAVAPVLDPTVPNVRPNIDARNILVWAPESNAEDLCIFSYALWYLRLPAIFVCQGSIPGAPHRFVLPRNAEAALQEAAVIVDTQTSDPGTALAFAGRGFGVVSAAATGAYEYLQAAATYHMHDFSSIYGAVTRARADRRTYRLHIPEVVETIEATVDAAQPVVPKNPPLVSIVVNTYNRPRELRLNLEALAKQTYSNFEVIVVNDSGEDVSAVVADFPFARYVCTPHNVGHALAANFGLRQTRGKFITQVADDDRYHPNFISAFVMALEASQVGVAHGNIAIRNDTVLADGTLETYGYCFDHDADHDYMASFWGQMLHTMGFLLRREVFESVGFQHENVGCAVDVDLCVKLSKSSDFVHVANVVGEASYRDNKSNLSSAVGDDLPRYIREALLLHLPPESQLTAQRIEQTVAGAAEGARRSVFFQPRLRLTDPIPVV